MAKEEVKKAAKKAKPTKEVKPTKAKKASKADDDGEESIDQAHVLEAIKKDLLKKAKENDNTIEQEEIYDATSMLDLTDEDYEGIISYFQSNKVNVVSDEEDMEDIDFDESKLKKRKLLLTYPR